MKKVLVMSLLGAVAAGCGGPLKMPPMMQVKHQHDKAYEQQEKLLGAAQVNLSVHRTLVAADSAINRIELTVTNPRDLSDKPDSVVKRAHKLAHLVVADLVNPQDYQAMTVTIAEQHDYLIAQSSSARTITYSIANLR